LDPALAARIWKFGQATPEDSTALFVMELLETGYLPPTAANSTGNGIWTLISSFSHQFLRLFRSST
jgi:hypothetical protein